MHDYYIQVLKTDEERMLASIHGVQEGDTVKPRVVYVFKAHLPWLSHPSALAVRNGDLVESRGGGEAYVNAVMDIGAFISRAVSRDVGRDIAGRMYRVSSTTFRKGQTGDWRNHFTEEHKRAFTETTGDLLIRPDYESDMDRQRAAASIAASSY